MSPKRHPLLEHPGRPASRRPGSSLIAAGSRDMVIPLFSSSLGSEVEADWTVAFANWSSE